jgi:uncharacterized OsmC-like protein
MKRCASRGCRPTDGRCCQALLVATAVLGRIVQRTATSARSSLGGSPAGLSPSGTLSSGLCVCLILHVTRAVRSLRISVYSHILRTSVASNDDDERGEAVVFAAVHRSL